MGLAGKLLSRAKIYFFRDRMSLSGEKSKKNRINLEWWSKKVNIGDTLAVVLYDWMLSRRNCSPDKETKKTIHLLTVGSVIGMRPFDAVIWGSGTHTVKNVMRIASRKDYIKYDVRAVRGPLTKNVLENCGYDCKNIAMGDPAVLMPEIYRPESAEKKYKVSLIKHLQTLDASDASSPYHLISVQTDDYKSFIDEIAASELVISSSLHGIILAEVYGVPAVFLNEGGAMDNELMKYYDWYYSTNRYNVLMARSMEEALEMRPMELPELSEMREKLIEAFPYDLWEENQ